MAIYAHIPVDQGADFVSVITVLGPDGLAFNLTGYEVFGQIRKTYTSLTAVDFYATIQDAENGKIQIELSAEQTSAIRAGRYLFDITIRKTATGSVTRVVEGQVEVNPQVTQISE